MNKKNEKYEITKQQLFTISVKLLTTVENYVNTNTPVLLECGQNHQWTAKISNILDPNRLARSSKGCPTCYKNEMLQKSIEVLQSQLPSNIKFVSSFLKAVDRKATKNKLCWKLKCEHGHQFEKESGQTKDMTCPQCSSKVFVAQERIRLILEKHFSQPMKSIRPDWLKNPETNRNLELDGYCEALKVAFEFQGRQHFSNDTQYAGDYEKQLVRDNFKKEKCLELGIQLLVIEQPRQYEISKFFQSVVNQLNKQNVFVAFSHEEVNFDQINDHNHSLKKYEEFKKYVEDAGFFLKSPSFSTLYDLIEFNCINGHTFTMDGLNFKHYIKNTKQDLICKECYKNETVEHFTMEKYNKVNQIITIDTCHSIAKLLNFTCLSTEYQNVHKDLIWKCSNGHIFHKAYREMIRNQTGKYCSECEKFGFVHPTPILKLQNQTIYKPLNSLNSESKILNKEWLINLLSKQNCILLDDNYYGVDVKHKFKCSEGHEFVSSVTSLKDKQSRRTSFCPHPECSGINIITLETCKVFAQENNLKCLSNEYKNVNAPMLWECSHGHQFEKNYRKFLRSKTKNYCPECS